MSRCADRRGEATIDGQVAAGFEAVADAFAENFTHEGEIGAAVCIFRNDEILVDLWGGLADRPSGRSWTADTPAPLFSTGKGAIAAACLLAASRGLFALDDALALHWPEFSARGKAAVTIRQVLGHASGLIMFGREVGPRELDDPAVMAAILADMQPAWPPGRSVGYQLATFGSILSHLIRRCDPKRRDLPQFFAEEVAAPLGLAMRFGRSRPDMAERARLSPPGLAQWQDVVLRAPFSLQRQMLNPFSRLHQALREVSLSTHDEWTEHDLPSGNAVGTARAVARLYADLAAGAPRLGLSAEMAAELLAPADAVRAATDEVMGVDNRWHLGFVRPSDDFPFARSPKAFGMAGLGGSFGFADPVRRIGYAYVPNRLGLMPFDDRRDARLRAALDRCLSD